MKQELNIKFKSYGHWQISYCYYGRSIYCTTTNSQAIDEAKDGKISAIKELKNEIRRKYKETGYSFNN
jgi:hypothetical protein